MSVYHIRCAQYQLHLLLGDQLAVPDFEMGNQKENDSLERGVGSKMFAWRLYYVPCQKRLLKIKYGFEGWFG